MHACFLAGISDIIAARPTEESLNTDNIIRCSLMKFNLVLVMMMLMMRRRRRRKRINQQAYMSEYRVNNKASIPRVIIIIIAYQFLVSFLNS